MAQAPSLRIAKARLSGETLSVLWYAIAKLDFENLLVLNQTEAAAELDMQQQNFSRAMAKLVEVEVIEKGPKVSGRNTYRLSPTFGWKGSAKSHREELNRRVKAAGLTVIDGAK